MRGEELNPIIAKEGELGRTRGVLTAHEASERKHTNEDICCAETERADIGVSCGKEVLWESQIAICQWIHWQ
jgi:hypothetical protein